MAGIRTLAQGMITPPCSRDDICAMLAIRRRPQLGRLGSVDGSHFT